VVQANHHEGGFQNEYLGRKLQLRNRKQPAKGSDSRGPWQSLCFQQFACFAEGCVLADPPAVRHIARNRESFDAICLTCIDLRSGYDHEPP
jgi:hypothetical protein